MKSFYVFVFTIPFLLALLWLPISTDEAYYFAWSQNLSWVYLDHPPLVAVLCRLATYLQNILGNFRILNILVFIGNSIAISYLAKICQVSSPTLRGSAAFFGMTSLGGLVFCSVITPDTLLPALWMLGSAQVIQYGQTSKTRHLILFFGFGAVAIYSKYTSLAAFGSLFLVLIFSQKKDRKFFTDLSIGLFFALLLLSPYLFANIKSHGATLSFQWNRGLKGRYIAQEMQTEALKFERFPDASTEEGKLSQFFARDDALEKKTDLEKFFESPKTKNYTLDYLGSLLLFWGFFLPFLVRDFLQLRKKTFKLSIADTYIFAVTGFPLGFFLILSFVAKIEANWVAPSLMMIPIIWARSQSIIAPWSWRKLTTIGTIHCSVLSVMIFLIAMSEAKNEIGRSLSSHLPARLKKEYLGFEDLGAFLVHQIDRPILTENYQLTSMMDWYAPMLQAHQLPGLSRPSELTRDGNGLKSPIFFDQENLKHGFYVLSQNRHPPRFFEHPVLSHSELSFCLDEQSIFQQTITIESAKIESRLDHSCQVNAIYRWYLTRYF